MLIRPGLLTYGDPEREAIWPILDAIEDGLDVENLKPDYRGVLAEIHDYLGRCIALRDPHPEQVVAQRGGIHGADGPFDRAYGPYGVLHAGRDTVFYELVRAGMVYLADVEAASDEDLLKIKGVGAKRLQQIRDGVARVRANFQWPGVPEPRSTKPKPRSRAHLAKGPRGIDRLDISAATFCKLLRMDLPLVDDVERADRDGLLVGKLGLRVLKQLRAEIGRFKAEARAVL